MVFFTEVPMNNLLKYPSCRVSLLAPTLACLCLLLGIACSPAAPVPGTVMAARAAEPYKEWGVSATGLREQQQRGTIHTGCAAAFDRAGDSIRNENENDKDFELLPGEMIPYAKIPAGAFWSTPDTTTPAAPVCEASSSECFVQNTSSVSDPGTTEGTLIYTVDDVPELTELYTILLEATGCTVRAFNDRAKALTALRAERAKPDLLITDCLGSSMSLDRFVDCCLVVHPSLRILMVSGYSQADVRFPQAGLDRFIQKPFTVKEFLQRVRVTLAT